MAPGRETGILQKTKRSMVRTMRGMQLKDRKSAKIFYVDVGLE